MDVLQKPAGVITRRSFLKMSAAGVGALMLSAYSGLEVARGQEVGGNLNLLIWEGYDDAEAAGPFLDETGVTLSATYIANNQETLTKIKVGGTGKYDIVTPYHGFIPVFTKAGILEPLDYDRLPNTADFFPQFYQPEWNTFDGVIYSAPHIWGVQVLTYNTVEFSEPPDTWDVLFEPEYKGKIVTLDDPLGGPLLVAVTLGFPDPDRLTHAQLQAVEDYLIRLKPQIRAILPGYGETADALARGEAVLGYNLWGAVTFFAAQQGMTDLANTVPREGTFGWCDSYCLAKDAPNPDAAYAFINHMIGPEAQAILCKHLFGGTTNKKAVPLMDEETRNLVDYENIDAWLEKAGFYAVPPQTEEESEGGLYTTFDEWIEVWERFKLA